jgi:hypothetical protein
MIGFTIRLGGAQGQLYPHTVLVVDYTVYIVYSILYVHHPLHFILFPSFPIRNALQQYKDTATRRIRIIREPVAGGSGQEEEGRTVAGRLGRSSGDAQRH